MKIDPMALRRLTAIAVFAVLVVATARAQSLLYTRPGDAAGVQYGASVAVVGDVDADGVVDNAVGAPFDDVGGNNAGMARVYSGRTLLPLFTWYGLGANDRLGTAVAGVGDLDGDGHAEVVVGAPNTSPGYALVFSGATGTVMYTLSVATSDNLGQSVGGGGDIDGDSTPDVLVGAPGDSMLGSLRGALFTFSGATGLLLRTHYGTGDYDALGFATAFYGDVDGDGRDEYVAGAPGYFQSNFQTYARAYDGASGTQLWQNLANWNDQHGWSVARIGDLSGDGIGDVLTGAPQDPGIGCACSGKGFVRVLNGVSGALIRQINGTNFYTGLGYAVTGVGDLDGDGFEDLAASAPGTEGCGSGSVPIQIRRGLNGTLMLTLPIVATGSMAGAALAFGDANGDGLEDLICGVPCLDANGAGSGALYVYTIVRSVVSYCESQTNSLGCTPVIAGVGTPSATLAQVFDVRATGVLNNKLGLLFYGFKPRKTPFLGGHMCIVSPTIRTAVQSSSGTAPQANDCSGVFTLDFNARIQSGVDPLLVAGEEVFAQYWSRDPADQSTTNLTNALAFYISP